MSGYWMRHRFFNTLILSAALELITVFLFVFPYIAQRANDYNSQSVYKNSDMDFIAPEPSFEQTNDLVGTNGIDKVFPFFLTKMQVNVNGTSRNTTILLSDQFQNVDITMYNPKRLIEKSNTEFDNPILVDWQFCHDTSAKIGDTVSFAIEENKVEYRIYAIYETNSIYDKGAILAQISVAQKESIALQSNNNGYSGIYIDASDYNVCQSYLTTEYRPLGRLKERKQFNDDEQYQVHYNAIMSSGYANEITDFRIRENSLDKKTSPLMIWLGAILSAIILIAFNFIMSKRGCEKVYFTKHCIPKGQNVRPYYNIAFFFEIFSGIVIYAVILILKISLSNDFIPKSALNIRLTIIPVVIIISGIINLVVNYSMVAIISHSESEE